MGKKAAITIFHLEMTDPGQLRPGRGDGDGATLTRVEVPCPQFNRFFYTLVGGDWYWIDRLAWSHDDWMAFLDRPEAETWVAYVAGTPAGYFELEAQPGGNVEIAYFGLLPRFVGRGLGAWLLTRTVRRAWDKGATRVWVHTCTLDHPGALRNYQARGFRLFREEVVHETLPEQPIRPWPAGPR